MILAEFDLLETARSVLFTPGERADRFAKAGGAAADAVILDWEDGVAGPAREQARSESQGFLAITPVRSGEEAVDE